MNETPPPFPQHQRKIDSDQLNLLAIFHFIGAGLAGLGILFLFGHFMVFHAVFTNPKLWQGPKSGPPPVELFAIFQWLYLVAAIWLVASGVLNVISAINMRARKHRMFSLVVAGINCVHIPLGTVLGVFTIITLCRDSVAELYTE